ncbi:MAK10-like protein [Tanacetum coccineum]
MMYNWIMRRKLNPKEDANRGNSNFIRRIKGMHVFIGNFTYVVNFMIVEDISSIKDPRLSQVVLGSPFIEISNMTYDLPEGVVRFTNGDDKILGFYKECLELGPEYVTGMKDEEEVTLYLMRRSLEVLRKFHWMILEGRFNQLSHVSSPLLSKPGEY